MPGRPGRSPREVLESHLALRKAGDLESDLAENYAEDVRLLTTGEGLNHGHDGVRKLAEVLRTYLPDGNYAYEQVLVDGDVGMLTWTGRGDDAVVHDGADSFVIRDGLIRAQTIHYSTRER